MLIQKQRGAATRVKRNRASTATRRKESNEILGAAKNYGSCYFIETGKHARHREMEQQRPKSQKCFSRW
jgi:hypothetical protein